MAMSMKALRVNANLTQDDMARILGISRDTYQQIESGKVDPKPLYIHAFCHVVGCELDNISLPERSTN